VTVEGSERSEVVFRADSDAHIVKGLIAVLLMMYNGKTPEEILSTDVEGLFERLELEQHLSVNRRNGFYSMTLKMKEHAAQATAAYSARLGFVRPSTDPELTLTQ